MVIEKEPSENTGNVYTSTTTPSSNETLSKATIGPRFVVPVIFIPGIMGSNLASIGSGNRVWFPANGAISGIGSVLYGGFIRNAEMRQTQLNPLTTAVSNLGDIKIKKKDKIGISEETARARGWGTVWWKGYGKGLIFLERYLNKDLIAPPDTSSKLPDTELNGFLGSTPWKSFTAYTETPADPQKLSSVWNPTKPFELLDLEGFENLADYAFPVFAEGYNWLQDNSKSAQDIALNLNTKVKAQVEKEFPNSIFKKFIIVTHSMGGLVARALIQDPSVASDIHGVVHGVMPASGAPTVYKRISTGWDGFLTSGNGLDIIIKHVFGATAKKLAPVLANSPGGMSLLPFKNFMTTNQADPETKIKPWLRLIARNMKGEKIVATLPTTDPYEDIYSDMTSWWRMINIDILDPNGSIRGVKIDNNPAGTGSVVGLGGVPRPTDLKPVSKNPDDYRMVLEDKLLDTITKVQVFQDLIQDSYHANTFAHYGKDPKHLAFNEVEWETDQRLDIETADDLIYFNGIDSTEKGEQTYDPVTGVTNMATIELAQSENTKLFEKEGERRIPRKGKPDVVFTLNIKPNKHTGHGDGTVCNQSAADVNRPETKQVFIINGYEHSESYGNEEVLKSVLYSVAQLTKTI